MRSDEFILSEGERQMRQKRRRRILILAIILLIVLVIGAIVARPVRRSIRSWQARRHAEKAFALIDAQKWSEARDEATAAYQLQPKEPAALRSVARLLSRASQADGLEFWKNLAEVVPLTRDDLREEARLALRVNDTARASDAAQRLLQNTEGGPAPSDWLIAADLAMRKQALDQARQFSENVLADSRSSRREQLQSQVVLANVAAGGNSEVDVHKVNEQLVALTSGTDDVSLDALVILAQQALTALSSRQQTSSPQPLNPSTPQPSGPIVPPEETAAAIEKHPLARTAHKLLATDLEIAQHRDQRDEIVQRTVERWKNSDNETLTALAAWLYRNGEFQRLVDAIPLDRALQTRELFLQHVDALAALGRWDNIRKIIETERFPLDPVVEHMYLARCFAQQGQQNGADNNWQRALEAAAGDPNKLFTLAEYAEKNDTLAVAAKAFDAAVAAAPKLRTAQQGRLRVAYRARDTRAIHAILLDLLKIWPNDPAVQNDEAYIRLLMLPGNEPANPELNKIEALAQKLIALEPASLPHRTLLALARLKQGRADAALTVYSDIKTPANAIFPSALAVHGAVLNGVGQREDARAEISRVPADKLLPEEEAGIANLR